MVSTFTSVMSVEKSTNKTPLAKCLIAKGRRVLFIDMDANYPTTTFYTHKITSKNKFSVQKVGGLKSL